MKRIAMAEHLALGKRGEDLAASWLMEKGFEILHRNWRFSHAEVDIIASKDNVLHFIEIKTRRTRKFGFPEESIDEKKLETLMVAAEQFTLDHPQWSRIQFDVLAITLTEGQIEYFFVEDIYL